ncbi:MAG: serine O-acetyltransferase EpsC [Acidobacteriota bacterium]|nr:serine acetyltransferase [Blastocatellia bacterium]MDW8413419.1 serine O-acetyltransferase EpsC [Acidobacteriota bacterium]
MTSLIQDRLSKAAQQMCKAYREESGELRYLSPARVPSQADIVALVATLRELIFPGYFGLPGLDENNLSERTATLLESLYNNLTEQIDLCQQIDSGRSHRQLAQEIALAFIEYLPKLRAELQLDVKAALEGDPAARSYDEIILAYPGLYAICVYRVAHKLYLLGAPLIPRIMTEHAHSLTGIDIHPAATIGHSFFIDHGTGVVIGETTEIGNKVKIYQGVTLGALSLPKTEDGELIRGTKRHPTIGDNVVIYAGATILGGNTYVGEGSIIGGNVWLTHSVEPYTKVTLAEQQLRMTPIKRT